MYAFWHKVFGDIKGGEVFTCFGLWHFMYIGIAIALGVFLLWYLRDKTAQYRAKTIYKVILTAFLLYMADFFIMPLAYGEINIEKLPFHVCTCTCTLCFLSYHNSFLAKYRTYFALLGFVSNLVYILYPAGVMWYEVHPLSYRAYQTLFFHSIMAVFGLLVLVYENEAKVHKFRNVLTVTVCMAVWALIGNYSYNASIEGYDHFFNWFFVVRDPFNMFPAESSPYFMPFLNIFLFATVEMLVLWLVSLAVKKKEEITA